MILNYPYFIYFIFCSNILVRPWSLHIYSVKLHICLNGTKFLVPMMPCMFIGPTDPNVRYLTFWHPLLHKFTSYGKKKLLLLHKSAFHGKNNHLSQHISASHGTQSPSMAQIRLPNHIFTNYSKNLPSTV